MFYISEVYKKSNKVEITDTRDNVAEDYSFEQLVKFLKSGWRIEGALIGMDNKLRLHRVNKPSTVDEDKYLMRARMMLADFTVLNTAYEYKCYIGHIGKRVELFVPDGVVITVGRYDFTGERYLSKFSYVYLDEFNSYMRRYNLSGCDIHVFGGHNLTIASDLLGTNNVFKTIDLSNFDMSSLVSLSNMFHSCVADTIKFGSSIINAGDARHMFAYSNFNILDLSMLHFTRGLDISDMFSCATIKELTLPDLRGYDLISAYQAFRDSTITRIDARNIAFSSGSKLDCMFRNCTSEYIDLSTLHEIRPSLCHNMFRQCKCGAVNLSNLKFVAGVALYSDMPPRVDMPRVGADIFEDAEIGVVLNDKDIMKEIKKNKGVRLIKIS